MEEKEYKIKRLDVFAKALIGIVGVAITFYLGFGQKRLADRQHELSLKQDSISAQISKQQVEFQTLNVVKDFLPLIDKDGEVGKRARQVVQTTASYMSEEYNNSLLAVLAADILQASSVPPTDPDAFQIGEARQSLPSTSGKRWFAVLASFGETQVEKALDHAETLANRIATDPRYDYSIEVYKTVISKMYAVTLGGKLDKSEAIKRANIAQAEGWADDAFAQIDRDWTKIE